MFIEAGGNDELKILLPPPRRLAQARRNDRPLVFSVVKQGGRQWASSPFPVTKRRSLCNGDKACWGPRRAGLSALFDGPGCAGGQVFAHGVTRRRIRHWGVWLGWYAGWSTVMQLAATSELVRIWYWGAQSFVLSSAIRI
ncbi:uncharacterized protein F4817DRAFT_360982 [Daldinia loculata]|uniref:uncharacterized protein n=1 Tax=Daldinia loculata TaxID=103429 RepID=UPI0020C3CFD8|nr:uncharacterized protein F4817DRAFT_360982 [Daldinia loculata]KAI1644198.1 hypothetical protein F4817DRAFT_360982 [Daldinia loculata]